MNATLAEILISALLIILPWAFGGVLPWSRFLIEAVAGCLALVWVVSLLRKEKLAYVATALLQLTVIAAAYFTFTMIQLPAFLVRVLSPHSAWATRGLQMLGVDPHPAFRISMDPLRTLNELLLLGAYFIIFFAVINTYRTKERIRRFFYILAGNALALSMFALVQRAFWNGKVFWVVPTISGTSFGTYINHNHFAGYIEMGIGAILALTLSHFAAPLDSKAKGWRRKFSWLASRELPNVFLGLFLIVVLVTAIIYSLSRGAILSLVLGLMLTKFLLRANRQSSLRIPIIPFVVVLVTVAALSLVGASTLVHRFSNLGSYANMYRIDIWQDAASMAKDYPVFGVGLGAFNEVFPAYKQSHFEVQTEYLESDWLQAVVEIGLLGMILIGLMVWVFYKNVMQRYAQRRDKQVRSFLFGGTVGVTALLVHSVLDFNMHIPANALTWFVLAGVVMITASTRDEGDRVITPTVVGTLTTRSRAFLLFTIGSLSLMFLVLAFYGYRTQATLYRWRSLSTHLDSAKDYTSFFRKPRFFTPLASEWSYEKAGVYEDEAERPGLNLIDASDLRRQGLDALNEALELAPGCGRYWGLRGQLLAGLSRNSDALRDFERALVLDHSSYDLAYAYGLSLLRMGQVHEGIVMLARARVMSNGIPLEPLFNYVLYYTRDPHELSFLVVNNPDDRAEFQALLKRNGLLP